MIYIKYKGNIHLKDSKGLTALHYASANGHYNFLNLLCEFGGDIEAEDRLGATALFYTIRFNEILCLRSLIEHNANLNHKKYAP